MNGGKYIPPYRKRLADDLLDKAEARETESLKDVLTRLARHKNLAASSLITIATMRVMGKVIMNHAAIRHGY